MRGDQAPCMVPGECLFSAFLAQAVPLLSCCDGTFPAQCCHAAPGFLFSLSLGLDLVTQGFGISPTCWNVASWEAQWLQLLYQRVPLLVAGRRGTPLGLRCIRPGSIPAEQQQGLIMLIFASSSLFEGI